MRRLFLLILLLFWTTALFAQDEDTVHVCGIVTVGTDIFYAGSGVVFYMQNSESEPGSGVMAYCHEPDLIPSLAPGDSVCFDAIIVEDPWPSEMIEYYILCETLELISSGNPVPEPIILTAEVFDSTGGADSLAEQYEACLVRIYEVTVDSIIPYTTTSSWICHDTTSHQFVVREASDSIDYLPSVGTSFYYIQGVVYHRFSVYSVQPAYMSDFGFSAYNDWLWHWPEQPIAGDTIYFYLVIPDDFEIVRASLGYQINLGAWILVEMTPVDDTLYNYILPPMNAGTHVKYYGEIEDTAGNIITIPFEAPWNYYSFTVDEMQGIADDESGLPEKITLNQNYPNPFNAFTTISLNLPEASFVKLKIYDLLGREVATLINDDLPAGFHAAIFSDQKLASGLYFYRFKAGEHTEVRNMLLLK